MSVNMEEDILSSSLLEQIGDTAAKKWHSFSAQQWTYLICLSSVSKVGGYAYEQASSSYSIEYRGLIESDNSIEPLSLQNQLVSTAWRDKSYR